MIAIENSKANTGVFRLIGTYLITKLISAAGDAKESFCRSEIEAVVVGIHSKSIAARRANLASGNSRERERTLAFHG